MGWRCSQLINNLEVFHFVDFMVDKNWLEIFTGNQ